MVDKYDPLKNLGKIKLPDNLEIDPKTLEDIRGKFGSLDFGLDNFNPLQNLPDGQLKQLMSRLNPRDQAGVAYQYEQFEKWQKNPKRARIDWLAPIYKERDWISAEEFDQLQTMDDESAYNLLRQRCSENAKLRQPNESIKFINIDPNSLGEKRDFGMQQLLREQGIDPNKVLIRALGNNLRLSNAIQTGNDRDYTSPVSRDTPEDGEELAMIRCGVNPSQTSYLSEVDENMAHYAMEESPVYLIYSSDTATSIGWHGGMSRNGFNVFHFNENGIMQNSLLAVIGKKEDLQRSMAR